MEPSQNVSTREDEARTLGKMLAEHEKMLEQATAIIRREEPIVASLKRAIAALMGQPSLSFGVLMSKARPPLTIEGNPQNGLLVHHSPLAANRPTKKAEYTQLTTIEAMKKAFERSCPTGFTHIDNIVREVYNPIDDNDVFYRVKRTLVSEIIRGIGKGVFRRGKEPNTFGLAESVSM